MTTSSTNGRVVRKPRAVIFAGGRGTRLAPYTSILPKPLMPVGDRSILELVVEQLAACDVTDITLCVGYLSHLIKAVFESCETPGVTIRHVHESRALGTAGPLRLVEGIDDTSIAMNGDILTDIDYADLVRYHQETENVLTIATHLRSTTLEYGVLHLDGEEPPRIVGFDEKPVVHTTVSMGVYVLEPAVIDYLPPDEPVDIPDLVRILLDDGQRLGAYLYDGLWFDIGRQEDYERAVAEWVNRGGLEAEMPPGQMRFDKQQVNGSAAANGHAAASAETGVDQVLAASVRNAKNGNGSRPSNPDADAALHGDTRNGGAPRTYTVR